MGERKTGRPANPVTSPRRKKPAPPDASIPPVRPLRPLALGRNASHLHLFRFRGRGPIREVDPPRPQGSRAFLRLQGDDQPSRMGPQRHILPVGGRGLRDSPGMGMIESEKFFASAAKGSPQFEDGQRIDGEAALALPGGGGVSACHRSGHAAVVPAPRAHQKSTHFLRCPRSRPLEEEVSEGPAEVEPLHGGGGWQSLERGRTRRGGPERPAALGVTRGSPPASRPLSTG